MSWLTTSKNQDTQQDTYTYRIRKYQSVQTNTSSHSTFSAIDTFRLITLHLPFFEEIDEKADFTVTEINHRFMTNRSHCNDLVSVLAVQFLSFIPECFETDPCLPLHVRTLPLLPPVQCVVLDHSALCWCWSSHNLVQRHCLSLAQASFCEYMRLLHPPNDTIGFRGTLFPLFWPLWSIIGLNPNVITHF